MTCPGERLEDEAYPKSREAFAEDEDEDEEEEEEEEEDYVGDLPPEARQGAGCHSKVEARSSEVNKTLLPHEWTQEVVLFQAVEVLGEGAEGMQLWAVVESVIGVRLW